MGAGRSSRAKKPPAISSSASANLRRATDKKYLRETMLVRLR
jgi:hypothetical protein